MLTLMLIEILIHKLSEIESLFKIYMKDGKVAPFYREKNNISSVKM